MNFDFPIQEFCDIPFEESQEEAVSSSSQTNSVTSYSPEAEKEYSERRLRFIREQIESGNSFPLVRSLTPGADFCVDLEKLSQGKQLSFESLCVRQNGVQIDQKVIWIKARMMPQENRTLFYFFDMNAKDLHRASYEFSFLDASYDDQAASLEHIAAPSFSGKKAMQIMANFTRLLALKRLFLIDQAVQLPCCGKNALCYLKIAEIFKQKKSWYEAQGITETVTAGDFPAYFETETHASYLFEKALEVTSQDKTSLSQQRFKTPLHFMKERFYLFTSEAMYELAKQFLYTMPVEKLGKDIVQKRIALEATQKPTQAIVKAIENFKALEKTIVQAVAIDPKATIGSILRQCRLKEQEGHLLVHAFQEELISNRYSNYYFLACQKLLSDNLSPSRIGVAIAFSLLSKALFHFEKIQSTLDDFVKRVADLLTTDGRTSHFDWFETYSKNLPEKNLQLYYSLFPPPVKIAAHAERDRIKQFVDEAMVLADVTFSELLQPALQYLCAMRLVDLQPFCPELLKNLLKECPNLNLQSTLINACQIDKSTSIKIAHTLIVEAMKHLEIAIEQLLTNPAIEDTYFTFMIAKQLCEQTIYRALSINNIN